MKFIKNLLTDHVQRYPNMQLEDVYKLLQQAALGAGHAADSIESLESAFEQELSTLGDGPTELLIDPISPDGKIARAHIRALAASKINPKVLFEAFVKTTRDEIESKDKLRKFCNCVIDISEEDILPFPSIDIQNLFSELLERDLPILRHSDIFREAYKPAYRIINLDYFPS